MKNWPAISTDRAVEIYLDAISCRGDAYFVDIPEFIEDLFSATSGWKIRFFQSASDGENVRKAAVFAGFDQYTLIVDNELWRRAKLGEGFANFVLAHELGHIQLNHHKSHAAKKHSAPKNYQLLATEKGLVNIPPTLEEYEANLWGVFFQCGQHLENDKWNAIALAKAARTEVSYVRRAQGFLKVSVFKDKLSAIRNRKLPPRQAF